ncbi:MerR family transcriptional regulator [Paenibacillus albiflavus]|nr:MerR family transcriptional regulator [Paenibacillus albiflavus]
MDQMRIGEFICKAGATKDTIRHYEDLGLIQSKQANGTRRYTDKHLEDYEVIQELKGYGLKLKDIQLIFAMKNNYGCGNSELIKEAHDSLKLQLDVLSKEEEELRNRRIKLEELVRSMHELHN